MSRSLIDKIVYSIIKKQGIMWRLKTRLQQCWKNCLARKMHDKYSTTSGVKLTSIIVALIYLTNIISLKNKGGLLSSIATINMKPSISKKAQVSMYFVMVDILINEENLSQHITIGKIPLHNCFQKAREKMFFTLTNLAIPALEVV